MTCKDAAGHEFNKTQYYHKQVYAQLSGPELSVLLDVEPMRPGEEECAAALRLLRRMRQKYGPRFFDVVVVDSWYANGPFLKTVAEELGWPVIAVLKQERYEAHQEALALTQGQKPTQVVERDGRQVEIWEVPAVRFTDPYPGPVRVVRAREWWTWNVSRWAGEWQTEPKEQRNWIWVVAGDLEGDDGAAIRDLGHLRWKIENNAFGELTQHWRFDPLRPSPSGGGAGAVVRIKIIAFTLFLRLCHFARQTVSRLGNGDAAGTARNAVIPLVALRPRRSALFQRIENKPG